MTTKIIGLIALMVFAIVPGAVYAAGGDHGHGHGIPSVVGLQVINFLLYAALLFYVLRKPVREFFKSRAENYKQALLKAEHAREEAEKKKREIQEQLTTLENTSESSIMNARKEAAALMEKIQHEAQEFAQKLKFEANQTVAIELEKAKMELRRELLDQAVAMAENMLKDKMVENDQKRLQTEFVDKVREAHP